ncbi:11021_t:CDS:2 [Paraglomus occultum]|uniref:11021_t:CDS:1 n=1 Tax=Paraglomus occultum TaxID=144539 RepID=A0A9N9BQ42_9GLOM|nr:11021_t:CDS:2 [Paraglomus occultum]
MSYDQALIPNCYKKSTISTALQSTRHQNGVGGRDSNSGSRRSGSNRTPQDYTAADVQILWQDFDRLFEVKRTESKKLESWGTPWKCHYKEIPQASHGMLSKLIDHPDNLGESNYPKVTPNFIIEIRSENDTALDVDQKMNL